jgi:hypothetical protein
MDAFRGKTFRLSDGRMAIMDKSDARNISYKSNRGKVAQLGNLKKLVENAIYTQDGPLENQKFLLYASMK